MTLIGSLHHLSMFQPIVCIVSFSTCTRSKNGLRCLTSLRSKKKTADNDSGEHQETSSTSSSSDCLPDNTAEDKSVKNQPNASETLAALDQPSASGKKTTEKRSFQKTWLRYYKWLKGL